MNATFCKALEMVLFCIVNLYFTLLIIVYHTVQKRRKLNNLVFSSLFVYLGIMGILAEGETNTEQWFQKQVTFLILKKWF